MNHELYLNLINFISKSEELSKFTISNINESKCTLFSEDMSSKIVIDSKSFKVIESKSLRKQTVVGRLLKGSKWKKY